MYPSMISQPLCQYWSSSRSASFPASTTAPNPAVERTAEQPLFVSLFFIAAAFHFCVMLMQKETCVLDLPIVGCSLHLLLSPFAASIAASRSSFCRITKYGVSHLPGSFTTWTTTSRSPHVLSQRYRPASL